MYKLLLCWRYLRTRYLALVCIVSVMLGVATLIVVNSVMAGFSTKLRDRLHGLLSDVVVEAFDYNGMADYEAKMQRIRSDPYLNDEIEAMTPTLEIFAMMQFYYRGAPVMRTVHLVGIQPEGRSKVGGFAEYLNQHKDQPAAAFKLTNDGRTRYLENNRFRGMMMPADAPTFGPDGNLLKPPPAPPPEVDDMPDPIIVGWGISHYRERTGEDHLNPEEQTTLQLGEE